MANSWIIGANLLGMKISLAGPPGFDAAPEFNDLLAREGFAGGYEFTTDAYADGDGMGSALITLEKVIGPGHSNPKLQAIYAFDTTTACVAIDMLIFDAQTTGTTSATSSSPVPA